MLDFEKPGGHAGEEHRRRVADGEAEQQRAAEQRVPERRHLGGE